MTIVRGQLLKWTNVLNGWQSRYFVCSSDSGTLVYYINRTKMLENEKRGCIYLKNASIGIEDEDSMLFTITTHNGKTFHFKARSLDERKAWVECLETIILKYNHPSNMRLKKNLNYPPERYNHCIEETQIYLQLMSEIVQRLEASDDVSERLSTSANEFLDLAQESLSTLEIEKNHISLGPQGEHNSSSVFEQKQPSHIELDTDDKHSVSSKNSFEDPPQLPSSLPSSESLADENSDHNFESDQSDDEFFDADETLSSGAEIDMFSRLRILKRSKSAVRRSSDANNESNDMLDLDKDAISAPAESRHRLKQGLSQDSSYNVDSDEEEPVIDKNSSVIRYLLGQLRIGMDLSRVTLPIFILEKRSLLEMYADYFAHPEYFARVCDEATPKERFMTIVQWYLSAFHSGHRSVVAKKPYNPIIGEIFQCYWVLDEEQPKDVEQYATEGPVPWARTNDVTFIAEQVSHHPPVSAIYAELVDKRIQLSGQIYTKSKFLGLSVGADAVGDIRVEIIDLKEVYICQFPSYYGRSILTVPWFELGGKCSITCPKTGYKANIEFHTKSMFNNTRHRISGDCFEPNSNKPFCSLKGFWNGVIYITYPGQKKETEFVNTLAISPIGKRVRPIEEQDPMESRNIWRYVTAALKEKDNDSAGAEKHKLEERQRADAKQRLLSKTKWITKLFKENADGRYVYRWPLSERLKAG